MDLVERWFQAFGGEASNAEASSCGMPCLRWTCGQWRGGGGACELKQPFTVTLPQRGGGGGGGVSDLKQPFTVSLPQRGGGGGGLYSEGGITTS